MKITDMRSYTLSAEWREWVVLFIETDSGITGVGEATLEFRPASVMGALEECKELLLGKDPTQIERHWTEIYRSFFWRGGAIQMTALSGIDQALWDIAGKAAGLPVHKMLGGVVNEDLPVYLNQWYRGANSTAELVEKAHQAVSRGAGALKWYPLRRVPMERQAYALTPAQLRQAVGEVEALRSALGPDIRLMVDLTAKLTRASAIQFCKAIEDYDLFWVEEPVGPENPDVIKEVSAATHIPIATGERLCSRWDFRPLLERQAVAVIQPDVSHAGGITEMRKIAAAAETYMIPVAPHNPLGPVTNAASLQLSATLPNFLILEAYENHVPSIRQEIVVEGPTLRNGRFDLPDRPGLGIEICEDTVKRLAVDPVGRRAKRASMT